MSFAGPLHFSTPAQGLSQPQVSSSPPSAGHRGCCQNGRPVLTDPASGQTVCSCQYSPTLLSYPRLPLLPPAFPPPHTSGYSVTMGAEGSAFYSPLTAGSVRETDGWRSLPSLYDPAPVTFYPYSGYGGLDLNARRKNATRESTNTLKAWLHEHIKNPYPTKGEKIMLAIITKMTLTQVSTWFANARRRLKKENKMTWSPRNRSEDGDDDDDDDDNEKTGEEADKDRGVTSEAEEDCGDEAGGSPAPSPGGGEAGESRLSPVHGDSTAVATAATTKPRIWSVSELLPRPSSCRQTAMKHDTMRCVPHPPPPPSAGSQPALTAPPPGGHPRLNALNSSSSSSSSVLSSHPGAAPTTLPTRGSGYPGVTSLTSYQSALASYAAHPALTSLSSYDVSPAVTKPAARYSPYGLPRPPTHDLALLREGE